MKSYDFNAVVYNDCQVACVKHFPLACSYAGIYYTLNLYDSTVHPIFAMDEWDYYPVCDICGDEHDYVNLTSDGRKYYNLKDGE